MFYILHWLSPQSTCFDPCFAFAWQQNKKNYNLPNPSQILVNHERYQWQKKCTNNLYDPVKISEKPRALIIASAFPLQMKIYLTNNKYTSLVTKKWSKKWSKPCFTLCLYIASYNIQMIQPFAEWMWWRKKW